MAIRVSLWVVVCALVVPVPAYAGPPSEGTAAEWAAGFADRHGPDLSVRFRPDSAGAAFLGGFRTESLARTPVEAAWRFLEREATILGLRNPRDQLRFDREVPWRHWSHVRFRQTVRGLPVIGRGLVLVTDAEGRVYQVAGRIAPDGPIEGSFLLDSDRAIDALRRRVPSAAVSSIEPAVLARGPAARYVYRAVVETGGLLDRFEVIQDAETGVPLFGRRLFLTAVGTVYDPNPIVAPDTVDEELLGLTATDSLTGRYAVSQACTDTRCRTLVRRAVPDTDGNYLYVPNDPDFTDPFAEVMGYHHLDRVNRFFNESLGYAYTCRGSNAMNIRVNGNFANAYFGDTDRDGCGDVVMGQGTTVDFGYDADVIYHEFTHGIVDATAGLSGWALDELGPDFSSGGLNEGTADYFSVTLSGDPTLGEYAAREGLYGELEIRDANNALTCPQNLTGESHFDGRIWVGTCWEIRTAIGAAKTDELVFAVLSGLSEDADFDEAGRGLLTAAERLRSEGVLDADDVAEVTRITNERGLPGCVRIIDVTNESGRAFSMGLEEMGGWATEMAAGVQFKIQGSPWPFRASFHFAPMTYMTAGSYDIYVRRNAPIHYSVSGYSVVIDGYDWIVPGDPSGTYVTFTPWSDPAVEADTTYYATFVHRNDSAVLMGVVGEFVERTPPEDAGDAGGDGGDAGDETVDAPADVVSDGGADAVADADAGGDAATPACEPTACGESCRSLGRSGGVCLGEGDSAYCSCSSDSGGGCDCRAPGPLPPAAGVLAALFGLAAVARRRRRR
jgi:Zn-dependent metalloprotease